jgi:hypothetical protein
VEAAAELLEEERVADAHRVLRELIDQGSDIDEDGVPRLHHGTAADRIISTIDPGVRHGRNKSATAL